MSDDSIVSLSKEQKAAILQGMVEQAEVQLYGQLSMAKVNKIVNGEEDKTYKQSIEAASKINRSIDELKKLKDEVLNGK